MKDQPSEFVTSALNLEATFAGMEQAAQSLERLELDSEAGLERAQKILTRFSQQSAGLQQALESFLGALDRRRLSVEGAAARVDAKAPLVAEKFQHAEEKVERFRQLADQVRQLTSQAAALGPAEVGSRLQSLSEQAGAIQEEARASKLRTLEINAKNLRANLKELARKLG